ncbi:hypothetical protein PGA1_262p02140 (plasmid) [Phaeobacter inhibens DSM 17395]|nr:STAS domain-containing protein [Phaeobacter inhibens]AFO93495.1 hypothetical protein PGA1_262p02140 [Phaeobacter inhibens DSM 17395]
MPIQGFRRRVRQSNIKARRLLLPYRLETCRRIRGCESLTMTTETQKHILDLPNAFSDLDPLIAFLRGARTQAVEIDCSNVAVMPSRCLQLLLSAEQQWRSEGLGFSVAKITEGCRKSLTLLGLEPNRFEDEETA